MNTSGVVLFAKQPDVVAAMHDQFRDQAVSKQYLALCMGVPEAKEFSVDVGIGQHPSLKWVPLAFMRSERGRLSAYIEECNRYTACPYQPLSHILVAL